MIFGYNLFPMATKRTAGRPKRDIIKVGIAMNYKVLALAQKLADADETSRILAMETAISERAQRQGISVTPEEAREMLGIEIDEVKQ